MTGNITAAPDTSITIVPSTNVPGGIALAIAFADRARVLTLSRDAAVKLLGAVTEALAAGDTAE